MNELQNLLIVFLAGTSFILLDTLCYVFGSLRTGGRKGDWWSYLPGGGIARLIMGK